MDWAELFDRASDHQMSIETIVAARDRVRDEPETVEEREDSTLETDRPSPRPYRIVADADVLAADLLIDGDARRAIEELWRHSWIDLLASDRLAAEAEAIVAECADAGLASDWRSTIDEWLTIVAHPAGDHPALATAYRGGAMHVLTYDESLTTSGAGAALRSRFPVSVREPGAFAAVFDPAALYVEFETDRREDDRTAADEEQDGSYPGPDRPPR